MIRIAGTLTIASVLCLTACLTSRSPALAAGVAPSSPAAVTFSSDDVSWLFPAPTQAQDFGTLIAVKDLTAPDPADATKSISLWPVFEQFKAVLLYDSTNGSASAPRMRMIASST